MKISLLICRFLPHLTSLRVRFIPRRKHGVATGLRSGAERKNRVTWLLHGAAHPRPRLLLQLFPRFSLSLSHSITHTHSERFINAFSSPKRDTPTWPLEWQFEMDCILIASEWEQSHYKIIPLKFISKRQVVNMHRNQLQCSSISNYWISYLLLCLLCKGWHYISWTYAVGCKRSLFQ